ncbi:MULTISPECIES: cysteine desulfurase family protein [Microcella]|uniref:cysteine desulfurase family protein n=1 Tax=Microcella TaxID=337004 RepID=UPI0015CF623E|nr:MULTISPECIES: cysteine desulfurase family protein [Microcella]QOD93092.1 cysteine desulfurase [Chryseoglobus sp. 28M-23]
MTIYLDHAATSPMPLAVRERYVEALAVVGNPSSIHSAGQSARALLDSSRARIAATIGVDPIEVTLTGGGTEAVNLAIKGLYWSRRAAGLGTRILAPAAEHHATLDAVQWLVDHEGASVEWLPVDANGRLRLDALEEALTPRSVSSDGAALLTMLWANNEVGTLQPVAEAAALAAAAGVPVHVDAIAAYGQVPLDPLPAGVSAVSISAHKVGGPVGVGALVLRRGTEVEPLLHGGAQQRGRSGTMDAAGAAGFAAAAEDACAALADRADRKRGLRDRLAAGIRDRVPEVRLSTDLADSLPGTLHVRVPGAEGDSLLFLLDQAGFAVSTGSACQAGVPEPSHVLLAMGVSPTEARGSLRVSLGPATTADEIDAFLDALAHAARQAVGAGLAARQPRLGR